jgi:sirohydrochlorin ferrochelatase
MQGVGDSPGQSPLHHGIAEGEHHFTSIGVWLFNTSLLHDIRIIKPIMSYVLGNRGSTSPFMVFPYLISEGWHGGRDTPKDLGASDNGHSGKR